jgi:glucose-1-phosphate adenylyltransferase
VKDTLVMIMAGGRGSRLGPLTVHRSKPAVPFAGRYRIIDFALSNFVNSGYRRIYMLTQYMSSSLIKHLNRNWRLSGFGEYIEVVPAQMRLGEFWYRGTADAVYQNLNLVRDARPRQVAVFGGDHVYMFAVDQMDQAHRDNQADLTVAALPVPAAEAREFGVIHVDARGRITGFAEKPRNPPEMPDRPGWSLVSMGNYLFRREVLEHALSEDASDAASRHDFGKDVIPRLVGQGARVFIYDFAKIRIPGAPEGETPYWRDVGTIDSYFTSNMELRARVPALDLYNRAWRIRTAQRDYPPARFVRSSDEAGPAEVIDSLVCEGSIISSACLHEVVLGYDCFVHAGAVVQDSVILSGCDIGAGAQLRRVVLDKNCKIAPGVVIGDDAAVDRARFPFVTESGIVVLPKGSVVPKDGPVILANDVADLIDNEPDVRGQMRAGTYEVSRHARHSYDSAGPRFKRYGAPSASFTPTSDPSDDDES